MSETVVRGLDGGVKITSMLGPTLAKRKGTETDILHAHEAGVEIVDGQKWERAHSQGRITGNESASGITYAPFDVNRKYQQHGIEGELKRIYQQRADGVEFELETLTECHSGTRRLSQIKYKLTAIRNGVRTKAFEVTIHVPNVLKDPQATVSGGADSHLHEFLRPAPRRSATAAESRSAERAQKREQARARVSSRARTRGAVSVRLMNSIATAGASVLAGLALAKARKALDDRIAAKQFTEIEDRVEKEVHAQKVQRAQIQVAGGTPHAVITISVWVQRSTDFAMHAPTDTTVPIVSLKGVSVGKFSVAPSKVETVEPVFATQKVTCTTTASEPVPVTDEELAEFRYLEGELAWCVDQLGNAGLAVEDRQRVMSDYVKLQQEYAEWMRY